MASTNKTTHYSLPQFVASDIPSWLGDFNDAMEDIDTAIYNVSQGTAESVTKTYVDTAVKGVDDKVKALNTLVETLSSELDTANETIEQLQTQLSSIQSGMTGVVYVGADTAGITAGDYEKLAKKA